MKYFIIYGCPATEFDGSVESFDTKEAAEAWLAAHPRYRVALVVYGREVKAVPAETVTRYRIEG